MGVIPKDKMTDLLTKFSVENEMTQPVPAPGIPQVSGFTLSQIGKGEYQLYEKTEEGILEKVTTVTDSDIENKKKEFLYFIADYVQGKRFSIVVKDYDDKTFLVDAEVILYPWKMTYELDALYWEWDKTSVGRAIGAKATVGESYMMDKEKDTLEPLAKKSPEEEELEKKEKAKQEESIKKSQEEQKKELEKAEKGEGPAGQKRKEIEGQVGELDSKLTAIQEQSKDLASRFALAPSAIIVTTSTGPGVCVNNAVIELAALKATGQALSGQIGEVEGIMGKLRLKDIAKHLPGLGAIVSIIETILTAAKTACKLVGA